jgi:hypothetical protein
MVGDQYDEVALQISSVRRRELARLAESLADKIEQSVKPHEQYLLRRMIDNLIDR